MTRLADLAKIIRSKNSGPFEITLDILFDQQSAYKRVLESGVLTKERIAALYQLPVQAIKHVAAFDAAMGIKITYLRPVASGTVGDRDVYGAQQYAPLLNIEIP